jgi:hypothetical protein
MMPSLWRQQHLPDLVARLAARPGHEPTRTLLAELLRHGFGADYAALDHEVRLPEVHGRADMLFGATVFEFKSDLRREMGDVQARLPDYLAERERQTGRPYLGLATDGATFVAFALRDGNLVEIGRYEVRADDGEALLAWLEPALSNRDDLMPEPLVFRRELGRESLTFGRARLALQQLWDRLKGHPELVLKRGLWDGLLRQAYGAPVGDDVLFLQHTYLTIIAKTLAARVLDLPTEDAGAILSGQALTDAGMNLWVGGVLATQQDLSALFWARGAERYLKPGGTIAFVLPYAALNRPAFAGLRRGDFQTASVRIVQAWSLELVRPLFPTSACAIIGWREPPGALPATVERYAGTLFRRDATEPEADMVLSHATEPWPPITTLEGLSPYRARFRQGATLVPRRFFLVEREQAGRLGASRAAPRVRGRTGPLDKKPWLEVQAPAGPVEDEFLRPILLGESVAPFRLLETALGVVPVEERRLLDARSAASAGHRHLASWLRDIEAKWEAHASKKADGTPRMTLTQQIDHMRKLSLQLAAPGPKIVYTASGTLLSAALVEDAAIIVEHVVYWAPVRNLDEAHYLCTIINSDTALQRVIPMQPRGWRDPRHFDKLIWELPIPEFDRRNGLHRELAAAAIDAEAAAASVPLPAGDYRRKRRAIRDVLTALGLSARMDALVARLLDRR